MQIEDSFLTIAQPKEALFKDRGSKFFGFGFPVDNEEDVKFYLQNLREIHPKATHHCYAYRLGLDRNNFRANDDGEPAGSAGKPILNVLYAQNLTNVLVVVVRYFGGSLLGVPGLINAYKQTTIDVLAEAEIVTGFVNETYQLHYEYTLMNDIMKIVKAHELKIIQQLFDNECMLKIEVRKSMSELVLGKLEKIEGLGIVAAK